jgi:YVTN family beta-propeller protein
MKRDETRRIYVLTGVLGIMLLAFFMPASIAGAAPYVYITNQGDDTVSVIDTANNTIAATIPVGSGPLGVAVSPDGTKLYVANAYENATVSVIDTATNTVTSTVSVGGTWPYGVAVSPDGTRVYVAKTDNNTVSVINTATNTVTATVNVDGSPRGVVVSPDGKKLYVTNYDDACVSVIDTATNSVIATVNVGNYPCGIAVSPDGRKVYVTNTYDDDTVYVIDTVTNSVTSTVSVGYRPLGVAASPDGTKLYVANNGDNTTSVIDTATNTVTATVNVGNAPEGVAVTPDGSKVYVTNYGSNNVSVIDTVTNTVSSEVTVGNRPIAIGKFIGPFPVQPVLPVANFSTNLTSGYAPLAVQFTDLSKNATSWNWNFGDGTNSTQQNTTHTYSKTGNYIVNLTVSNANGTDSKLGTINVSTRPPVLPVADFSTNLTSGYAPLTVQFTDLSKNATSWNWNFGDGANSTQRNTTHTYSAAGIYTVKETASNADGKDTEIKTNSIAVGSPLQVPVADFSASKTTGNAPLTVSFTDKSTGKPTSWKWNFGDGSPLTTKYNPTYTYSKAGIYTVKETVSNAAGKDTEIKTNYITVKSSMMAPIAAFSTSPPSGSAPLKVQFTDKSINSPASWNWNFGDGTYSTSKNPAHTYNKAGKYTVSLVVKNAAGNNIQKIFYYVTSKK